MNKEHDALLVVMAKEPEPGRVKTRLCPPLRDEEAAALSRALIRDKIAEMARLRGADLALAYTPKKGRDFFEPLVPEGMRLFAQRGRGVGERMLNIFRDCLAGGYRAVSLTGTDIPELPHSEAGDSLQILLGDEADLVLGPTPDGGYYLIGLRAPHEGLFSGIPWSTPAVMEATLVKALDLGLRCRFLPHFSDIDTLDDLRAFVGRYREGSPGTRTFGVASALQAVAVR